MNINTKTRIVLVCAVSILLSAGKYQPQGARFQCFDGNVSLKSVATLELIEAKSQKLRGVIDTENQSFAWTVDIRSFQGFNSPLQREHFNENYMESEHFPKASFAGKIIEKIDFEQSGPQSIRAKGKFIIHGVEQERIIKCQLENKGGKLCIKSTFTVPIVEHDIAIPKIVNQKIAEEIQVNIDAVLSRQ